MRIGELARRAGVTVRTIHYYIEEGLLPQPPRRGKYGEFDESYLQRLRLIQQLKAERLSLPAIRSRLLEMGLAPAQHLPHLPLFPSEQETFAATVVPPPRREGLFRSRFAEEAGLTPEQVSQLESLGLIESSEGLLPVEALPLARSVARLLARGATSEDIAEITRQARQEAALHHRLLEAAGATDPLSRALQWQEQAQAVATIRQMLLRRQTLSSTESAP